MKKTSAGVDTQPAPTPVAPAPVTSRAGNGLVFQPVDEIPTPNRGSGIGRAPDPETLALIEQLRQHAESDQRYVYLGVKHTGQFNQTLRNAGVHETFRRREDGEYDRFAKYFGVENLPPQRVRRSNGDAAE